MVNALVRYADVEIRIHARGGEAHKVELTVDGERQFEGRLDAGILPWVPGVDPTADGDRLFAALVGDPELRTAWAEARGAGPARRLRLRIDEAAPELHALPWELLRETSPDGTARHLAAAAETPFSRYLAGAWRPGQPVFARPVRLLVAIADPDDLARIGLAPIDADTERTALEEALAGVGTGELEVRFLEPPITLEALEAALRDGPHLLHLLAHGSFDPDAGQAVLYLAAGDNRHALVRDHELAEMLARLGGELRLVFLASCRSAERSPADACRGLAPRLVAAGVPAVVAMQDRVEIDTARCFATTFYTRLLDHGLVDLAANEARSALVAGKLPGAAVPALYLRLKNARLFGRRGQVLGEDDVEWWDTLLDNIAAGECTPLLGPRVAARVLPTPRRLARSLAAKYSYPFPDVDRLPRVAQFVATRAPARREVLRLLGEGFRARHGLGGVPAGRKLSETIRAAGWSEDLREGSENEVHHQLAELGLPLYLTTNFDNLMTLALEAHGRRPRRERLDWSEGAAPERDFDPPASPEAPVVLHLFGNDDDKKSIVLTEDDHLDYLSRLSRHDENLVPASVAAALAEHTLLFLGFELQDLALKVLMHGLLSHLDTGKWEQLHVAVQVDDTAGETPETVKRYLETYFDRTGVKVYWGSTGQFVAELHERWRHRHGAQDRRPEVAPPPPGDDKPAPDGIDTATVDDALACNGIDTATDDDELAANGIDAATGGYAHPSVRLAEVPELVLARPPDRKEVREATAWRHEVLATHLDAQFGIDPRDLAQAGWGVVFAQGADPRVREALGELLGHRRRQAAARDERFYRELHGEDGYRPEEKKLDFLVRHGTGPGPANPARGLPYYLLLVGSPEEIPFRFQHQLDLQYAVGRLSFSHVEEYERYAAAVVAAEKSGAAETRSGARRAVFFGARNTDDRTTHRTCRYLVERVADFLRGDQGAWRVDKVLAEEATKARLAELFGGGDTPAFLFAACHGVAFARDDHLQLDHQGALLCQDWPGPGTVRRIRPEHYFAAHDLARDPGLEGLVAFLYACHGAGTPRLDAFSLHRDGQPRTLAPRPFVARLPQRLLAGGALAVVGHVERSWCYSFIWKGVGGQSQVFEDAAKRLLEGYPVGAALEPFGMRYAELAAELVEELERCRHGAPTQDPEYLPRLWTATNDARNYVILGDPAVRLPAASTVGEKP